MRFDDKPGLCTVTLDDVDERVAWQIVASRIKDSGATLRDEYLKTVDEMVRLARELRDEPVVRKRPNGDQWTFKVGKDGLLRVEIARAKQA